MTAGETNEQHGVGRIMHPQRQPEMPNVDNHF